MQFTAPKSNDKFTIDASPSWPSIQFVTDQTGPHVWQWSLIWGSYNQSGNVTTNSNTWDAQTTVTNLGGTLRVKATAGNVSASIDVLLVGTNPSAGDVTQYLATNPNNAGFDKIIDHESKCRHFDAKGQPIRSFDNGYGMCQLTTPAPSFDQVWNWKRNVDGGQVLFAQKRGSALAYLGQGQRSYTTDQLTYETVCRWNGGRYHEWDAASGSWVRNGNVLCDSATGNIGWELSDPNNSGKTEATLHARDAGSYSGKPGPGAHWKYSGVCYADSILR